MVYNSIMKEVIILERLISNTCTIRNIRTFIKNYTGWYHFSYTSGANPYIAVSDKVKIRMLLKYNGKFKSVQTLPYIHFVIDDKEESEVPF